MCAAAIMRSTSRVVSTTSTSRPRAGAVHALQVALALLGKARHDRHAEDAAAGPRPEAGRTMLLATAPNICWGDFAVERLADVVGVMPLDVAHPARAAAREHGEGGRVVGALAKTIEELARLLHDGEVGAERRVEHVVKPHSAQGADQPPGRAHAGAAGQRALPTRCGWPAPPGRARPSRGRRGRRAPARCRRARAGRPPGSA